MKRAKRIVMDMVGGSVGGVRTYIRHFLKTLPEVYAYNEWFVFVHPRVKEEENWDLPARIRVLTSRFAVKSFLHRLVWQNIYLPIFMLKNRIDVLFSAGHFGTILSPCRQVILLRNATPYGPGYLTRLLGRSPVKDNLKMRLQRLLSLLNIRFSDAILTPTKAMREIVGAYSPIPLRNWRYAYYGYAPEPIPGKSAIPIEKQRGGKWIAYIAHHIPFKNYPTVIEAASRLQGKAAGVKFVVTADFDAHPTIEEKILIDKLGLGEVIIQLGDISRPAAFEILRKADIVVFASLLESFGHPMVEAMANGLPVVAADLPVNRELLGDAALFFSPLDSDDLARNCLLLLENSALRTKLVDRAYDRAKMFTWERHIGKVLYSLSGRFRSEYQYDQG